MTHYLTLAEILAIHAEMIRLHGGDTGIHDVGLVESALAQPRMTFAGEDLYPTLIEKAAALGFSLISNHGFKDGNKRVGFTAMDVFLRLNGFKIVAPVDEAETIILDVASHRIGRDSLASWVEQRVQPM